MKIAAPLRLILVLAVLVGVVSLQADDAKPALPRLVDLGAGKCIPCKQMKPILDELKRDYANQFETVFIDVWENREEGPKYGIRIIPTQIFYDVSGKERFRHEGFMAKKDILAKWRELGVEVKEPPQGGKR
jgi:thioredoxin 1